MILPILQRVDANQPYESLGSVEIEGFEPRPAGEQRIRVIFSIDETGALSISAKDVNKLNEEGGDATLIVDKMQNLNSEKLRELAEKAE